MKDMVGVNEMTEDTKMTVGTKVSGETTLHHGAALGHGGVGVKLVTGGIVVLDLES